VSYASVVPATPVSTMDTYQSLVTLTHMLRRLQVSKEKFDQAIADHAVLTKRTLIRSAETFGLCLASFLNMFRPHAIFVGGELLLYGGRIQWQWWLWCLSFV
jgi:predicted NBD/HSP70 family sugar kinase